MPYFNEQAEQSSSINIGDLIFLFRAQISFLTVGR
jgi:hypothetical protein